MGMNINTLYLTLAVHTLMMSAYFEKQCFIIFSVPVLLLHWMMLSNAVIGGDEVSRSSTGTYKVGRDEASQFASIKNRPNIIQHLACRDCCCLCVSCRAEGPRYHHHLCTTGFPWKESLGKETQSVKKGTKCKTILFCVGTGPRAMFFIAIPLFYSSNLFGK